MASAHALPHSCSSAVDESFHFLGFNFLFLLQNERVGLKVGLSFYDRATWYLRKEHRPWSQATGSDVLSSHSSSPQPYVCPSYPEVCLPSDPACPFVVVLIQTFITSHWDSCSRLQLVFLILVLTSAPLCCLLVCTFLSLWLKFLAYNKGIFALLYTPSYFMKSSRSW